MSAHRVTDGEKLGLVAVGALVIWWLYTRFVSSAPAASTATGGSYATLNMPSTAGSGLDLAAIAAMIHRPISGKPIFPLIGFVSSPGGTYLG